MRVFFFLLLLPLGSLAQTVLAPLNSRSVYTMERLMIHSGMPTEIHPEIKSYAGRDIAEYADSLFRRQGTAPLRRLDYADLQYLSDEFNDWSDSSQLRKKPFLRYFYRSPAYVFEINKLNNRGNPIFRLRLNPMLNISAAKDQTGGNGTLFQNHRGVELRAEIDQRVFLYTSVVESQARFASYINQRIDDTKAVPGAGFYKTYRSNVIDNLDGRDYNVANAYIGFQATKHIGIQFGHGNTFLGNGYRSLMLSDYAPPRFFFKINTRVWKFHYQNLFMELSSGTPNSVGGNTLVPKKYAAIHYLNYNLTPKISIGLFEATVLNRSRQFELQYLNPIILYRTVEGIIGSPDNVILGGDARWNIFNRFQLYGQLVLDEFIFKELKARSGYWANKYAFQAGIKYINAFNIDHLDLQAEFNIARPYTWSHLDSLNSYSHFNQPLAHPLGANFKEWIGIVRWQPMPHFFVTGRVINMQTGDDPQGQNFGTNILLSYTGRVADYGNKPGQGIGAVTLLAGLDLSWEFYRNTFIDFHVLLRDKRSDDPDLSLKNTIFGAGIRMNMWTQNQDY